MGGKGANWTDVLLRSSTGVICSHSIKWQRAPKGARFQHPLVTAPLREMHTGFLTMQPLYYLHAIPGCPPVSLPPLDVCCITLTGLYKSEIVPTFWKLGSQHHAWRAHRAIHPTGLWMIKKQLRQVRDVKIKVGFPHSALSLLSTPRKAPHSSDSDAKSFIQVCVTIAMTRITNRTGRVHWE